MGFQNQIDLAGNDIVCNAVRVGATTPGAQGTELSGAELAVLDVTAGAVTASKAVVADSNKDAGDFRNLDAVNIDAGADAVAGTVDVFPATTASGKIIIQAANSAGAFNTTITNASMAASRTVTIPDPGGAASFVMTEGAQTVNGIKTMASANIITHAPTGLKVQDSNASHLVTIAPGDESADRTLSIPVLGGADTVMTLGTAQTVSGIKTFSAIPVVPAGGITYGATTLTETIVGGVVVGAASGYKIARSAAPVSLDGSNPTSVAHGLTTCLAVCVQLVGSAAPGDSTSVLTAVINGANVDVYAWKHTTGGAAGNPTLVASTGTETFNWIAIGT